MAVKARADIIITNGSIYTADVSNPFIRSGAVAIAGNSIVAIGLTNKIVNNFSASTVINANGAIVHPGMIDTHSHLMTMPFHGFPLNLDNSGKAALSLADVKTETDDESVAVLAAAATIAFLRTGCTLVVEAGTVFQTDAYAEAVSAVGSRGLISAPYCWDDITSLKQSLPTMFSDKLIQYAPLDKQIVIERLSKELRRNKQTDALVNGFVCLYGMGSASDELLVQAKALASEHNVIFNQHESAIRQTTDAEIAYFGEHGLDRLARLNILDSRTMLTHVNNVEEHQVRTLVESKTAFSWCPHYNMRYGMSRTEKCYFPEFYHKGSNVSVAIDGVISAPIGSAGFGAFMLANMIGEPIPPSAPFYMQTILAAKCLGLEDKIGSIEVGKRADIVIRKPGDITQQALDEYGATIGMSSSAIPVETVIVDGRIIYQQGYTTCVDEQAILANAIDQRDRVIARANA